MSQQLSITPTPFKSSNLTIPPSPFSPQLPITPPACPPKQISPTEKLKLKPKLEFPPPPGEPLNWLWQCHICNRVYQLGVTRRCLDDGHFFCAGTTTVKRSKKTGYKKTIRHKACASEFDYQGWKAWGSWRRDIAEQADAAEALMEELDTEPRILLTPIRPSEEQWLGGSWTKKPTTKMSTEAYWKKDCWNTCDYPSECRWGKQFGIQTPVKVPVVTVPSSPSAKTTPEPEILSKTSFDDILLDVPDTSTDSASSDRLETITELTLSSPEESTKKPSMDDLLESAKRRKRRSAGQVPSPLSSNPPSPASPAGSGGSGSSTALHLQRAFDDFDLEFRKSFGRAGEVVTKFVTGARNTAAEEEKAEKCVKGLKIIKGKGMF